MFIENEYTRDILQPDKNLIGDEGVISDDCKWKDAAYLLVFSLEKHGTVIEFERIVNLEQLHPIM